MDAAICQAEDGPLLRMRCRCTLLCTQCAKRLDIAWFLCGQKTHAFLFLFVFVLKLVMKKRNIENEPRAGEPETTTGRAGKGAIIYLPTAPGRPHRGYM